MQGPWHVSTWDNGYQAGWAVTRTPPSFPPVYFGGGEHGKRQAMELCATLNAIEARQTPAAPAKV